jgi:hypothetical protein
MTCADALEAMLEADPHELRDWEDTELSRHLRECGRCRSVAVAILEDEALLARGLESTVPHPDLDRIIDQALGANPTSTKASTNPTASGRILRFPRKRTVATLFPLAAAAALAALLLGRSPELPGDPYHPAPEAPGLGLEVPEGRNVAVLATKNPEITVLWFF